MADAIIKIEHVCREFCMGSETVRALKGIDITIKAGEFVTIMGTSGSGKSTLLNILGCLDRPTKGEYYLDGTAVSSMNRNQLAVMRNRKIGFVFQSYNLLPRTTSLENVELPLFYNSEISDKERRRRAEVALELVGLKERLFHKPNQLSGGQQQRVAIARALVNNPVVLLADEATGNLDTRTSYEIMALFQDLHKKGRTIVFVTHENDIALFSTRSIRLRDGKVVSDRIIEKPVCASEALAGLPIDNEI